ncbi:MAG: SpoIID/LytB domain-containing protein [Miltoncostaeaceae bacterium]
MSFPEAPARRGRRPTLAASVAFLALAAGVTTAGAQENRDDGVTFRFEGRGWGHGVGMSQWGAYGRARAGWSAARILRHYYRQTSLDATPNRPMRVLLAERRARLALSSDARLTVVGEGRARRLVVPADTVATVARTRDGGIAVSRRGARGVRLDGPVTFSTSSARGIAWGPRRPSSERRYRGRMVVAADGPRRLRLVNRVPLEAYLRGVVPREMPARWGDEAPAALRAQAVAARSYALATRRRGQDFDAYDDVRSQVYGGLAAEDRRADRAVAATRGRVVTHAGRVATTFFFSTSGGRTEDAGNVFGSSAPYLRSVADPFDRGSPYHRWPDPPSFSPGALARALGLGSPVTAVRVLRRGKSPRVVEALVVTRSGARHTRSGTELRRALGLRDTWFTVVRQTGGNRA